MVFLFNHHGSLNLPVELCNDDENHRNDQYNNDGSTREPISLQRQLKELTLESKEFLIALGFKLKQN